MGEIKSLADELVVTGSPLTSEELTIKVLSGLGPEYKEILAAIRARDIPISFKELYDKLLDHEVFLKHKDSKKEQLTITAQLNQRSSSNNRPRGNNFNSNRMPSSTTGLLGNQHKQQNGYPPKQSNNQRDLRMGASLLQGQNNRDLYEWPSPPSTQFAISTNRPPLHLWHARFDGVPEALGANQIGNGSSLDFEELLKLKASGTIAPARCGEFTAPAGSQMRAKKCRSGSGLGLDDRRCGCCSAPAKP
uniref:Uncharacterized protein n=1 Tax=Nicotiana tabacum TaxID=4097 RepID=A0A1S4CUN7_TOBAC|nr:PREDICTED: uncharacterized protein LOC107822768 [Nicotiana tabacum]